MSLTLTPLLVTLGSRDLQRLGTAGNR